MTVSIDNNYQQLHIKFETATLRTTDIRRTFNLSMVKM